MEFLPDLTPACKKGGAEEGNPSLTGLPLFARGGKAVEDVSASVSPLLRSPAYVLPAAMCCPSDGNIMSV